MKVIYYNTPGQFTILPCISLCWARSERMHLTDFRIILNWADIEVELWWLINN